MKQNVSSNNFSSDVFSFFCMWILVFFKTFHPFKFLANISVFFDSFAMCHISNGPSLTVPIKVYSVIVAMALLILKLL